MIALLTMSLVVTGALCVLAYRLAIYALPVMLGFGIAQAAHQVGAGTIEAGAVGFIAGAVAYGTLSVAFVSLRSPVSRAFVGLVFALPAAGAGYALLSGITLTAIPSDMWRQMFSALAGLLIGVVAFTRLSGPAATRTA